MNNWRSIHSSSVWMTFIFLLIGISVSEAISCFECSSVDDNYCPDGMTIDDEGIVPLIDCKNLHEAQHCVKQTGVAGEKGISSGEVQCFVCDESGANEEFGCSDPAFSAPLKSCRDVFDARYCIKATGLYGGSLGTRRFCSSRDMGNYCEYIKRPGDQLEYRSCVFTCSGNGCNGALSTTFNRSPSIYIILATSVLPILLSLRNAFFIGHPHHLHNNNLR